tara:strand:- start:482 stop:1003 length:522 start_codon:yes stop_codon:yes gene_type:complete
MISNIFEINCINIDVLNWDTKKNKLLKLLENYPEEKKDIFHTNKHLPRSGLLPEFCELFDQEVAQLQKETKMRMHIKDVWTVTYKENEFHNPHNHGHLGFNGVLYLDYIRDEHSPTYFVCPFPNPLDDQSMMCASDVYEGQILAVPAYLTHYTSPNKSKKPKRILAFDFNLVP